MTGRVHTSSPFAGKALACPNGTIASLVSVVRKWSDYFKLSAVLAADWKTHGATARGGTTGRRRPPEMGQKQWPASQMAAAPTSMPALVQTRFVSYGSNPLSLRA